MPGEVLITSLGTSGETDGVAPAPLADTLALERRSEPRSPTNWIAMIRLPDRTEIPCTVKDVSKSGAGLGLPDAVALPATFQLRVLGYAFLFRVRLVWRGANRAGVRIEQFAKQPAPVAPPREPTPPAEPAERYSALRTRRSRFSSF